MSGDNSSPYYDEPTNMTQDLIELGIPANHITQDYAGFRTLDSIVRAQKNFGLEQYTIVSQKFHCQRDQPFWIKNKPLTFKQGII